MILHRCKQWLTWNSKSRPGGGGWGPPSENEEMSESKGEPNLEFQPRGSVHAFGTMAEAAS